jgi:hypothetical protein
VTDKTVKIFSYISCCFLVCHETTKSNTTSNWHSLFLYEDFDALPSSSTEIPQTEHVLVPLTDISSETDKGLNWKHEMITCQRK